MADEAARYLEQSPAHRGDAMPLPAIPQSGVLEEDEEIVGDDADPEKCGIGVFLTTGHPFHTKADFEFLDAILGMLTPLAIPDQHISGTLATIAGDDVVTGPVLFQEFPLMDMAYHDETKGFVGGFHAVYRFGDRTVGIVGPGRIGNGGDGRQGGGIQSPANGKGLARLFAVVEQIRLIAGGIRSDRRQGMPLG